MENRFGDLINKGLMKRLLDAQMIQMTRTQICDKTCLGTLLRLISRATIFANYKFNEFNHPLNNRLRAIRGQMFILIFAKSKYTHRNGFAAANACKIIDVSIWWSWQIRFVYLRMRKFQISSIEMLNVECRFLFLCK